MKKTISFLLAILLMTSCFVFHSPDANALGAVWVKEFYKDKFGDTTDEYYLTNKAQFKGSYNSETVSNGKLGANLIFERVERDLLAYAILFVDKDQVKNRSSSDIFYTVSVKRADGSQFDSPGVMPAGDDRIKIDAAVDLANALIASSGEISLYIEENNNTSNYFLFKARSGNFNDLFNLELPDPDLVDAYAKAEELLAQKKYVAAEKMFIALGNYKDSAARVNEAINALKVGNTIFFGSYEQDNDLSNGKEDIEWIVLAQEGNKRLLLSKYVLDLQQYDTNITDLTWEHSTIRTWLNNTFFQEAFTLEEQGSVLTEELDNSEGQSKGTWKLSEDKDAHYWSTGGENNTRDQIFLLSCIEVEKYIDQDALMLCEATPYVQSFFKNYYGSCGWYLRSPNDEFDGWPNHVSGMGGIGIGPSSYEQSGIRPALWLSLENDT